MTTAAQSHIHSWHKQPESGPKKVAAVQDQLEAEVGHMLIEARLEPESLVRCKDNCASSPLLCSSPVNAGHGRRSRGGNCYTLEP